MLAVPKSPVHVQAGCSKSAWAIPTAVGIRVLIAILVVSALCREGFGTLKLTSEPSALDVELTFLKEHLRGVLTAARKNQDSPNVGLSKDAHAVLAWLTMNTDVDASAADPIAINMVLSGAFSVKNDEHLHDIQVSTDIEKRRQCVVAWHRFREKDEPIRIHVHCLVVMHADKSDVRSVSRSFEYIDHTWRETTQRK